MIEGLVREDVIKSLGGRFKLTALVQHRVRELMEGARPLVEREGRGDIELAVEEIVQGKIDFAYAEEDQDTQPPRESP